MGEYTILLPDLIGLGERFPQPEAFPESSGSPQPVCASVGFPQAAVPLSTEGLDGEPPPPHTAAKHRCSRAEEKSRQGLNPFTATLPLISHSSAPHSLPIIQLPELPSAALDIITGHVQNIITGKIRTTESMHAHTGTHTQRVYETILSSHFNPIAIDSPIAEALAGICPGFMSLLPGGAC